MLTFLLDKHTLALVCVLIPWSALQVQAEASPLVVKIGNTTLPDGKYYDGTAVVAVPPEDNYAYLNGSTLTLFNFNYTADTDTAISIDEATGVTGATCTIEATGTSTVTAGSSSEKYSRAMFRLRSRGSVC